jgi:hypothetical protein
MCVGRSYGSSFFCAEAEAGALSSEDDDEDDEEEEDDDDDDASSVSISLEAATLGVKIIPLNSPTALYADVCLRSKSK